MTWLSKISIFLSRDIWRLKISKLSRGRRILIKQIRVVVLAFRGFAEDRCSLRASALTFLTLLSIVPVFALAFGIAKGFSLESVLETQLTRVFHGNEMVLNKILEFSRNQLHRTHGTVVAGVGIVFLLWTVLKLVGNIEHAFNDIWGIRKPRPFGRKITDYLIIIFIAPVVLAISGSLTAFLSAQPERLIAKYEFLRFVGPAMMFSIQLFPFIFLWLLFSFVYIFIPNTKVRISSAIVAGFTAAFIFHCSQWAYFKFQVTLFDKYSAIYGSLAAFPLFLMWLEVSWMILLFGSEMSFAAQNADMYEFEQDARKASVRFKRLVALYVLDFIVSKFKKGEPPPSDGDIINDLDIPARLARLVLDDLEASGQILCVVGASGERERNYVPAIPLDKIRVRTVLKKLDELGVNNIPLKTTKELRELEDALRHFDKAVAKSKGNIPLGG